YLLHTSVCLRFFFTAEAGIRDRNVTGVQTCALPIFPVVPTILINYHVAEEKLPWRKWLLYVTIGVAPSSLIYALGGDAVIVGNVRRLIVLGVIIALGYVLVSVIRRRSNKRMQEESAA